MGALSCLAALLLGASAAVLPAEAQGLGSTDGDLRGVEVDAEALVPGAFVPGRDTPLVVTVSSERVLRGTLQVRSVDGWTTAQPVLVPVEVPAGGSSSAVLVASAALSGGEVWGPGFVRAVPDVAGPQVATTDIAVEVVFAAGGASATTTVPLRYDPTQPAVGVLPALAAAVAVPDELRPLGLDDEVPVAVIDERIVDAARSASLGPFRTVVGAPSDIASPALAEALPAWVAGGGHLVVMGSAAEVEQVPAELRPPDQGMAALGAGTIRRLDETSGGGFDDVLAPGGAAAIAHAPMMFDGDRGGFGGDGFVDGTLVGPLLDASGLDQGSLGAVLWLALAYVVVVGPVLFVVLRRTDRRPLGWLAVPAVALVATFGIVVVGSGRWSDATPVQASAVLVAAGPDGASAEWGLASSVVVAPRTGGATVEVATTGPATVGDAPLGDARVAPLTDEGDRLVGRPSLDPGTAAVVAVRQSVRLPATPTAAVVVDGEGRRSLEVTNPFDGPLRSARLVGPQSTDDLGDLGPGAHTFAVPGTAAAVEEDVGPLACGRSCAISASIEPMATALAGPGFREPGTVTLVGTVEHVVAPVLVDDDEVVVGTSTFVVPVTTTPAGELPDGGEAPADVVAGAPVCPNPPPEVLGGPDGVPTRLSVVVPPGSGLGEDGTSAVLRLDLLGGAADVADARLVVPGALAPAEVFDGERWVDQGPGCPLPPGALSNGSLLVRTRTFGPDAEGNPVTFAELASFVGGGWAGLSAPYREIGLVRMATPVEGTP